MGSAVGGLLSAAAPIVGGMIGGPTGAAIGSGVAGLFGGQMQNQAFNQAQGNAASAIDFTPSNVSGGLGGATFGDGTVNLGIDPRLQAIQGQQLGAGAGILGGLSQPGQVAQDFFSQGMGLLAPGQQQARSSLENRLFAQGRLGSTGGAQQFGGLLQAQNMANQQLAQQSLFRGTQQRGQEIGQANQLFGGATAFDQLGMNAARLGMGVGAGGLQAGAAQAPFLAAQSGSPMGAALSGFGSGMFQNAGMFGGGGQQGITGDFSSPGFVPAGGSFGGGLENIIEPNLFGTF